MTIYSARRCEARLSVPSVSQYFLFNKTGKYIGTFSIRLNELSGQTCTTTRKTGRCISREINKMRLAARSRINAKSVLAYPPFPSFVNAAVIVNHCTVHRRIVYVLFHYMQRFEHQDVEDACCVCMCDIFITRDNACNVVSFFFLYRSKLDRSNFKKSKSFHDKY